MKDCVRILHLEDNQYDSDLVAQALRGRGTVFEIKVVRDQNEFFEAVEQGNYDVVLSDNNLPGIAGELALQAVRQRTPGLPFIFVSGFADDAEARAKQRDSGATNCLPKANLARLRELILQTLAERSGGPSAAPRERETRPEVEGMEQLVEVVQELSLARNLERIMAIVRRAARQLTGADGATFVLRDGDQCHYADEDAIAPLWKGRRFSMSTCISGWVMLNRQAAVIEDIYADARIPADAYRPTFVKSLAMVPIRTLAPIGAIGAYWAAKRQPLPREVKLLQALADSTSVAMENVQLYTGLEAKVEERTARLQLINDELENFSHTVSHDLRAPLRHIKAYAEAMREEVAVDLKPANLRQLDVIHAAAQRMETLIRDLLDFARMGRAELQRAPVDMAGLVAEVRGELAVETRGRTIHWQVDVLPAARGDRALLKQVWVNLLSNAIKYTGKRDQAEIHVSARRTDGEVTYAVQDNGAGFDMKYAEQLFGTFQRLHRADEFDGTGLGLANVRRIISRHGGRTWAEAMVDQGATFYFTLAD